MDILISRSSRRTFLGALALGASGLAARGAFADELERTPHLTEGPFYPRKLPLDTDNDLIKISNQITPAVGEITHLGGRILDAKGDPIKNALVEIWQVDANGVYLEQKNRGETSGDSHFQGYGRFLTSSSGEYYFRTIKPVLYPGRQAPHIHYGITLKGREMWTTQCFIKGYKGNARDGVFRELRGKRAQELVSLDFNLVKDSKIGELAAKFDIVMGATPEA